MLGGRVSEVIELECPDCGALAKTTAGAAEKGKVRCPNGHEFAVMGMLDYTPSHAEQKPR